MTSANTCYLPNRATCPAYRSMCDFIIQKVLHKLQNSSLCKSAGADRLVKGLGYNWTTGVQYSTGAIMRFSLSHRVCTGSVSHPASYPMCTEDSLPGGKAVVVWRWRITST